ncbi:hypothetical protein [uncultured Gimesia sp.]|uniref:hypothetical protein n=1 Tax=uncultured Gimesia sp. TaxID=1678688 RepID=UPI0026392151|nr:hypothetical protein [uncultured Gimesia sp.]
MKKLSVLLIAVVVFPLIALAETKEENLPVGRYDITFSAEGVYFLDTATGALWLKQNGGEWERIDSPVNRRSDKKASSDKPVTLALAKGGATMPMVQRERRKIPGSSDTLSVQLGDITGGQVFVEVIDVNGHYLVKRTSLKNNEFLKFELDGKDVYLQIVDMINNFIGDDICKVRISFEKPKSESKKETLKESREKS